jgi:RNA polymerase sigma-70 factor (ECF subfamily)
MRPRFQAPKRVQSELLQRFLKAVGTGEMEGLISLLANDVALHSDGGGKAVVVPNVVQGAEKVARGIIGALQRLVPKDMVRRIATVNGKTGLVNYQNGRPHSVLAFDAVGDKIQAIYIVTNPEKLSHIPNLDLASKESKFLPSL